MPTPKEPKEPSVDRNIVVDQLVSELDTIYATDPEPMVPEKRLRRIRAVVDRLIGVVKPGKVKVKAAKKNKEYL